MNGGTGAARVWFMAVARGFADLVEQVPETAWDDPGLGEWSVRDLVGHGSRSLLTLEAYAGRPVPADAVRLDSPAAYYRVTAAVADPAEITERGRAAGAALGAYPLGAFREITARVVALLAALDDATPAVTPYGTMTLADYLPTRAFELTVHGLDLARAIGAEADPELFATCLPALHLVADLAGEADDRGAGLLLALTGRTSLPPGYSVL